MRQSHLQNREHSISFLLPKLPHFGPLFPLPSVFPLFPAGALKTYQYLAFTQIQRLLYFPLKTLPFAAALNSTLLAQGYCCFALGFGDFGRVRFGELRARSLFPIVLFLPLDFMAEIGQETQFHFLVWLLRVRFSMDCCFGQVNSENQDPLAPSANFKLV